MAADDGGVLELTGGNHLADPAADTGGLGLHDDAAFHVVGENVLCGAEGGSGNVQILQTHFLHQHLADHIVPVQNGIN